VVQQRTVQEDDAETSELARLRHLFRSRMPLSANVDRHLGDALQHLLRYPGRMARPRIAMHAAMAYGLSNDTADDLAIGLEYFHTASLVFDDLPCMDDASERRDAVCVHRAHGESHAILAALAFVNRGYALLWRAILTSPNTDSRRPAAYIEENLGTEGLLNGQSLDLNYASLPHDRDTTERIAFGKTVSLIRLALVLPALLGHADEQEIQQLERIALHWGFAYQIFDDLKDVLETSVQSGKTTARDAVLDRPNVSLTIGIEPSIERLTQLIRIGDRSLSRLLDERPALGFLNKLRDDLGDRLDTMRQRVRQPREGELR
jgi:geranylgeranyl pyrophosphate synthase